MTRRSLRCFFSVVRPCLLHFLFCSFARRCSSLSRIRLPRMSSFVSHERVGVLGALLTGRTLVQGVVFVLPLMNSTLLFAPCFLLLLLSVAVMACLARRCTALARVLQLQQRHVNTATAEMRKLLALAPGAEAMAKYSAYTTLPVQWGEMDSSGAVNGMHFFRYLEAGRIFVFNQLAETLGVAQSQSLLDEAGLGPILASTTIKYKAPLTHPDEIVIGVKHKEMGDDYLVHSMGIFSLTQGRLVAEADSRIVVYDYAKNKKTQLPEKWRKAVLDFEAANGNSVHVHTVTRP
eukprot:m.329920 g.329920  ORF g.329920 m.329920 type:complete len:291 (-) comp55603_c1_seq6:814-1686(-)